MAVITANKKEADGHFPAVCMACGQPATVTTVRNMSWVPPWTGVLILAGALPYVIIVLVLTKKATIQAPFCDKHQRHWVNRTLLLWGTFFLFGAIGICSLLLAGEWAPNNNDVFGGICVGFSVLILVWLCLAIYFQMSGIRPTEITDKEVTLTGVSAAFVDATEDVRDERRARQRRRDEEDDWEDDYDDSRPRRRRQTRDDDDDDEPRSRRKRSSDEFEE